MDDLISRQDAIRIASGYCHPANIVEELAKLPSAQPEIIRCKDCKHRPIKTVDYDDDSWDCGFNIKFPDYRCPCQCEDGYYNRFPDDDWYCADAERRTDGKL